MEGNFWIIAVRRSLDRVKLPGGIQVYLFGSATQGDPGDIDLLVVYEFPRFAPSEVLAFRERISLSVYETTRLSTDFVILSVEEEREVQFALREGAVRVL